MIEINYYKLDIGTVKQSTLVKQSVTPVSMSEGDSVQITCAVRKGKLDCIFQKQPPKPKNKASKIDKSECYTGDSK